MAITSTQMCLFWKQGGFGGGHGDFDRAIAILGLPWDWLISLVPDSFWPNLFSKYDAAWLIALPFVMNIGMVFGAYACFKILKKKPTA